MRTAPQGGLWLRIVACLAVLWLSAAAAMADVKVSAHVDQTQVGVGEPINYKLTLEYAGGEADAQPSSPDFGGLVVQGGPNQAQQISSINGAVRFSLSYNWILEAPKEGRYVIGPALVQYQGKVTQSQPIMITAVTRPQTASVPAALQGAILSMARTNDRNVNQQLEGRLFLRADVSNAEPYVGEAVIITYSLYNDRIAMQSVTPQVPNDVPGAVIEELLNAQSLDYQMQDVGGRQYQVARMYRLAVIPNQAGDLTVSSYGLAGVLQTGRRNRGDNDPFGGFFNDPFFAGGIQMQIPSPTVKMRVQALPSGAPGDFSGTIGDYQIETSLDHEQISEDDLLTYKVNVHGRGAIDQINPPKFPAGADFEIVGQTPQVEKANKPDELGGRKIFEFVLRPKHGGKLEIPPLQYGLFNPWTKKYEQREGKSQSVLVTPGKQTAGAAPANPAAGTSQPSGAAPLHGSEAQLAYLHPLGNTFLMRRPEPLMDSPLLWLPQLLAAGGVFWAWRRDRRQQGIDTAQLRRGSAWRVFDKRLKGLQQMVRTGGANSADAVQREAAALEQAVRGLIDDRFNLAPDGLTRPEIERLLLEHSMSPERVQRVCDLLDACANVRYAPTTGTTDVRQWAEEFNGLLREGLAA
jgi:hypothetical protein